MPGPLSCPSQERDFGSVTGTPLSSVASMDCSSDVKGPDSTTSVDSAPVSANRINNHAALENFPAVLSNSFVQHQKAELADLQGRATKIFAPDQDAAFGDAFYNALLTEVYAGGRGAGTYSANWLPSRVVERRTPVTSWTVPAPAGPAAAAPQRARDWVALLAELAGQLGDPAHPVVRAHWDHKRLYAALEHAVTTLGAAHPGGPDQLTGRRR